MGASDIPGIDHMKSLLLMLAAAAPCALFSATARADIVYNNPVLDNDQFNCVFNTTCGPTQAGITSDFAAQLFTIGEQSTINTGAFTELLTGGGLPTSVNWMFLANDGAGGLPGTVLSSGSSPVVTQQSLGPDAGSLGVYEQLSFNVSSLSLAPGSYYFAIQAVTTNFSNFLTQGTDAAGAAETPDGGTTWTASYEGLPSVAVELSGTVPEPGSLAVIGVALAGLGVIRRRRERKVSE